MVFNMLARGIGLVGTLVITRYLSPGAVGEVQVAVVLVTTAHFFSLLGLGHYVASKPDGGPRGRLPLDGDHGGHRRGGHRRRGAAARLAVEAHRAPPRRSTSCPGWRWPSRWTASPSCPSRVLIRDMRFRTNGLVRTAGEVVFPFVAVGLAADGWGGHALVWPTSPGP